VNKNVFLMTVLFLFCIVISSFSGSMYWNDGEIVRAPQINFALDEKLDQSGASFFQLAPQSAFATSTAAVGTVYQNATGAINFLSTGTTWVTLIATTTGLEY